MSGSPWARGDGTFRGSTTWEKRQRLLILRHYRYVCQLCHLPIAMGLPANHPRAAQIHHLVPIPGYSLAHCVPAHRECNLKAGSPGRSDPEPLTITRW
jgi:5-methylcytosine-specific restriction endonuclease McrA